MKPLDEDRARSAERREMVRAVERIFEQSAAYTGLSRLDRRVRDAMLRVRRHAFVEQATESWAYDDRPLPIGCGQTISQPFIVALMTQLANIEPGARVLEIGTGSGYQAAVLSELGATVDTVEVIAELAERAAAALSGEGYDDVAVHVGDGFSGWPEAAPYDAIIVTAAARETPPPLIEQLAPGGRVVLPVGEIGGPQQLLLIRKRRDGTLDTTRELPVAFVPLVH